METKTILTKKQKWLKVLEYSLPALISIFVFLFAMICKGIYPFGKYSLAYTDYNEGLVPSYTGLWDFLHGNSSFMVSFNLGAGGSLFSSFVTNGFFSPISLLIGIFPKEYIMHGIALLIVVRFALMATTAYICFKKCFPKINQYVLLLFSLIWTFSGWTMIHYTNIGWLDIMILLPLLILCAKQLVEKGKIFWFVITLSYMLILSYYITYMVLVGTVIISTVYIFTICEKQNRMKVASNLFYAIFISLLISFVTFIPSCVTSLGAHRFSSSTTASDKADLYQYILSKLAVVIMYSLPIYYFSLLMGKLKKDRKNVLFFMISFIICSVGILIEPINKMWHTGSYFCYPLRYGFVIIMLLIFASLYYIDKYIVNQKPVEAMPQLQNIENNDKPAKKRYFDPVKSLLPVFFGCAIFGAIWLMFEGIMTDYIRATNFRDFAIVFFLSASSFVAFLLASKTKNKKLEFGKLNGGVLIFILCAVQIVCCMIGYTGQSYLLRTNNTARIENAFKIDTSDLEKGYKIKDKDYLYNSNFAYFINYPTLQTWIHISSEEQWQAYTHLGYNTRSTILYSAGGTIMTDALLGNRYILSQKDLDLDYYTFIKDFKYVNEETDKEEIVHLYELKFGAVKGFTTNVNLTELIAETDDVFEVQNIIYKAIFGVSNNVMTKLDYLITKDDDKFTITLNSTIGKILYVNYASESKIIVRNKGEKYGLLNGLNDLSTNLSEHIELEILKEDNKDDFDKLTVEKIRNRLSFADFNAQAFKNAYENSFTTNSVDVTVEKDKLTVTVDNTNGHKYVFVPFINLKNMVATNNGEETAVNNAFYNFMTLELVDGTNQFEISYEPQLLKPCLIITLCAIFLFILFSILNYAFKFSDKKFVIWVGIIGACVILLAVGFLVYLKPFFNTFVILFS